jgi:hypothetical protein
VTSWTFSALGNQRPQCPDQHHCNPSS